jgi:hypothetical protein
VRQMARDDFAERRAGNIGVELAVHVGVEMEPTGETVCSQGENRLGGW